MSHPDSNEDDRGRDGPEHDARRFAIVGAVIGAVLGVLVGPIGVVVGAVLGGAIGYAVGYVLGTPKSGKRDVTLTMAEPAGDGAVNPPVGTHTYPKDSEVAVTADPDEGWQFDRWLVDGTDGPETPDATVTMGSDRRMQAVFGETDQIPELEAPPVDDSESTTIDVSTEFLYSGDDPVQVGVDPADIKARRAAVVRGRVVDRGGDPVAGVTVSVLDRPEFGHTRTRTDGRYDMAVNGGGELTVDFQHDGHLSAQRSVEVPWQDFAVLSDVVLVRVDDEATVVDLSEDEVQTHRAETVVDDHGERTATVLVPEEVSEATMTLPDGGTRTLDEVTVRATEYTAGDAGPEAMPAELPPQVAYTYAVELSVDEALDADATDVAFDEPVVTYVDDFVGFGAGQNVPTAYYDRERGEWIPAVDGVIVEVVGKTNGRADLDVTGDGDADGSDTLEEHGITDAERTELADLYDVGDVFWRVSVDHFSPWDCNWPFVPPEGAEFPGLFEFLFGGLRGPDVDCQQTGSTIDCVSQSLRTDVDVVGTDQALHYSSRRAPARRGTIEFPVTGDSLPEPLERVDAEIHVAGQVHTRTYDDPQPGTIDEFRWDGLDAYGRPVQGEQPVTVRIGYVYEGVYGASAREEVEANFGWAPTDVTGNRTREEITLWQTWTGSVGAPSDPTAMSIGGWTLTDHHRYDARSRSLYLGDGTRRTGDTLPPIVTLVAGRPYPTFAGAGRTATAAKLDVPAGIAEGPDGSIYIADTLNQRIRRVDPDGDITVVAGSGPTGVGGGGFSGDGGPATEAELFRPEGVSVGPDGGFFIADTFNHRIRRVDPDGIITTVAGNGERGFGVDGGPATEARLNLPNEVEVGPDGSFYVVESSNNRIRRVGPDGIIATVAGTGERGFGGDDGPATEAELSRPSDVAVGPEGSLYVADASNHRVRRVGLDGIITTVAGTGERGSSGDGGPATDATLNVPTSVAVGPEGSIYVADGFNRRIRRVGTNGIIVNVAGTGERGSTGGGSVATDVRFVTPTSVSVSPDGDLYVSDVDANRVHRVQWPVEGFDGSEQAIASSDGTQLYVFGPNGRHLETLHTTTGATLREFEYDATGRLVGVTDGDGNTLGIERDDEGAPTAITAPFGQQTDLATDDDGYLSSVTDPAGQQWQLSHTEDGLLESRTDPRGHTSEYDYDEDGLLVGARDPGGVVQTLSRTRTDTRTEVVHTSAEGRETRYTREYTDEGGRRAVTVTPSGTRKEILTRGGLQEATYPDGTTATLRRTGDPRFGMQAPMVDELTVTTPDGRTLSSGVEREVTLSDRADLLSVDRVQDTVTINDQVSERVYDVETGEVTVTSAAGREWTAELDEIGRPLSVDGGADLATERFDYDERGLLTELGHGDRLWTYAHDALGRVERVETAESQTFDHAFDDADRLVSTTLPSGASYGFAFDATELPTRIDMPSGAAHELEYSHFGRIAGYTPPEATAGLERSFDADRWLRRRTLPSGRTVDVSYDEDLPAGEQYPEATVEFGYATGEDGPSDQQRTATWTPTGDGTGQELAFEYDGTLVTETDWIGTADGAFSYDYDDDFFLTGVALSSGDDAFEAELSRDEDGALTGFGPFTFDRGGPNQEVSAVSDGTLSVTLDHNAHAEVSSRSHRVDGELVYDLELVRDDAGRIVRREETVDGDTTVSDYAYDDDSRLTEVRRDGDVVEAYEYDGNANRVSRQTGGGPVETATYDSQDRLVELGDVDYEFDEDGFLSRRGEDTFTYSARGELLEATVGDRTVTYTYDAFGRRVARTDGEGTSEYLYGNPGDPYQVTAMRDSNDVLTVYYYDPDGHLFGLERGGERYYVATDQVGTPRVVTDDAGEVVRAIDADSFGNRIADSDPDFELGIGFAGGLTDPVTGLVHFGMRDYDPDAGRFTARDPILFGGEQANLYVYVNNSPVTLRDPSGLQGVSARSSLSGRGVKIGGSFFVGFGGGAELVVGPDGISFCAEAGIGKAASVDVDPYAKYATAGTRTKISAGVGFGPASVGAGVTFDPCSPRLGFKTTGGFGPATLSGSADGFEFSAGGKPGDLSKNIRDTVSTSNMRFGAKVTVTVEGCWAW